MFTTPTIKPPDSNLYHYIPSSEHCPDNMYSTNVQCKNCKNANCIAIVKGQDTSIIKKIPCIDCGVVDLVITL